MLTTDRGRRGTSRWGCQLGVQYPANHKHLHPKRWCTPSELINDFNYLHCWWPIPELCPTRWMIWVEWYRTAAWTLQSPHSPGYQLVHSRLPTLQGTLLIASQDLWTGEELALQSTSEAPSQCKAWTLRCLMVSSASGSRWHFSTYHGKSLHLWWQLSTILLKLPVSAGWSTTSRALCPTWRRNICAVEWWSVTTLCHGSPMKPVESGPQLSLSSAAQWHEARSSVSVRTNGSSNNCVGGLIIMEASGQCPARTPASCSALCRIREAYNSVLWEPCGKVAQLCRIRTITHTRLTSQVAAAQERTVALRGHACLRCGRQLRSRHNSDRRPVHGGTFV